MATCGVFKQSLLCRTSSTCGVVETTASQPPLTLSSYRLFSDPSISQPLAGGHSVDTSTQLGRTSSLSTNPSQQTDAYTSTQPQDQVPQNPENSSRTSTTGTSNGVSSLGLPPTKSTSAPSTFPGDLQQLAETMKKHILAAVQHVTKQVKSGHIEPQSLITRLKPFNPQPTGQAAPVSGQSSVAADVQYTSAWKQKLSQQLQTASQQLNDLTGYSLVEVLKLRVDEADAAVESAKKQLHVCKDRYDHSVETHNTVQKEMNSLLQRRSNWQEADAARFADLCKLELRLENEAAAAKDAYNTAINRMEEAQSFLWKCIRERYTEEQLWSDKIRRASTVWTWGLMVLHFSSFLAIYFVLEPRKQAALRQHLAAMLEQDSQATQTWLEAKLANASAGAWPMPAAPLTSNSHAHRDTAAAGGSMLLADSQSFEDAAGQTAVPNTGAVAQRVLHPTIAAAVQEAVQQQLQQAVQSALAPAVQELTQAAAQLHQQVAGVQQAKVFEGLIGGLLSPDSTGNLLHGGHDSLHRQAETENSTWGGMVGKLKESKGTLLAAAGGAAVGGVLTMALVMMAQR